MRTVLGLSKTSTSIGWVLVDEQDIGGDPLDHDTFDLAELKCADPAATARRACAIATATGYTVDRIHITSSDHIDTDGASLRKALAGADFDAIVVPLATATKAWATGAARANGHDTTAVCILDRESVSLFIVDIRDDSMQTATTTSGDTAALIDWLTEAFAAKGSPPQSLFVIGARSDLESLAAQLDEKLSISVVATREAQVVLARGAAISDVAQIDEDAADGRTGFTWRTRTLTGVAVVVAASLFALTGAAGPLRFSDTDAAHTQTPPPATPAALVYGAPADVAPPEVQVEQPASAPAVSAIAPEAAPVQPPAEHLPQPQPADHLPGGQPIPLLGPAPTPEATPEVVAPPAAPPAPFVPPSENSPPPPIDPIGSLFFGALP